MQRTSETMFKSINNLLNHKNYHLLLLIFFTFIANCWTLSSDNGFAFDDWVYLMISNFKSFSDIFSFLPHQVFNDRPIGLMFIKLMYQSFGLNSIYFYFTFLVVHLCNTLLVWKLCSQLLQNHKVKGYEYLPLITAGFFGIWPKSIMAVQWISAVFDLLGFTFILLVFYYYILYNSDKTSVKKYFFYICTLFFYFLALRTKEMTVTTPILIIFYELCCNIHNKKINIRSLLKFRPSAIAMSLLIITVVYLYQIFQLRNNALVMDVSSPYFFALSPMILIENIFKYISMYFDFKDIYFGFPGTRTYDYIVCSITIIILLMLIIRKYKHKIPILTILVLFVISLSPVLPLKNHVHILYLYLPSIFMSAALSIAICKLVIPFIYQHLKINAGYIATLVVISLYLITVYSNTQDYRAYWLSITKKDKISLEDIKKLPIPPRGANIYVELEKEEYNIFTPNGPIGANVYAELEKGRYNVFTLNGQGQGHVNNIIFNDPDIKTFVLMKENFKDKKIAPYLLLKYDHNSGHVKLLEKNFTNKD